MLASWLVALLKLSKLQFVVLSHKNKIALSSLKIAFKNILIENECRTPMMCFWKNFLTTYSSDYHATVLFWSFAIQIVNEFKITLTFNLNCWIDCHFCCCFSIEFGLCFPSILVIVSSVLWLLSSCLVHQLK